MVTASLAELLAKYDQQGPRYTSYPTAPAWSNEFSDVDHRASLQRAAGSPGEPMAMYVHLPFCRSMCFYCGCSVIVTQDLTKAERYVDDVLREARLARAQLTVPRPVVQHHWGGGTPTFLPPEQLERLFCGLRTLFPVAAGAEISIEVDPRVTTSAHLEALRNCGFNRISIGVQDFDAEVQHAIHREQSFAQTRDLVEAARALGFVSVNLDLVYGLPHQIPELFDNSIALVLSMRPDRLACYGYAHVPWLKKHQRVIAEESLPKGAAKLALYLTALHAFRDAGYVAIGMDHFALPNDALALAAETGVLHRNFMGYTTHAAADMLSFGVTSISEMSSAFAQNTKTLQDYRTRLDAGELPVERGLRRNADDEARRRIILDLMCRFRLDFADHGGAESFQRRYATALAALAPMCEDGLTEVDDDGICVTPVGRLFVRNIAMPFDNYLEGQRIAKTAVFSRTV